MSQPIPGSVQLIIKSDLICQIEFVTNKAKYNYLKEKYGKNLVADWPEVTDPQKFVFEDIAIAAYLLTVFSKSHNRKGFMGTSDYINSIQIG